MFLSWRIARAVKTLTQGGIIAYPTESVYGLGCDPFNQTAVMRLLQIKQRSVEQGLILIAADWQSIKDLIHMPLMPAVEQRLRASWPGPTTWVLPASAKVPTWIRGQHDTVAIRLTAHPLAALVCQHWHQALVSTSANRSGQVPAKTTRQCKMLFGDQVKVIAGRVGKRRKPSTIQDLATGKIIRP